MKILALEKDVPGGSGRIPARKLREEASRVWGLSQSGVIREAYFQKDRPSAVLVLECRGAREARRILSSLPLVSEGRIAFDVIPLVAYPGFARLFSRKRRPGGED